MKKYQRRQLKHQAQAILFCGILIWMLVNVLTAIPAMAFHPEQHTQGLESYDHIEKYGGYAYAHNDNEEVVAHKENEQWKILCKSDSSFKTIEIVKTCKVPTAIARHLKVLSRQGINHDLFMAKI